MKGTYEAAKTSITSCMGAKPGEKLLILTDEDQMDLARGICPGGKRPGRGNSHGQRTGKTFRRNAGSVPGSFGRSRRLHDDYQRVFYPYQGQGRRYGEGLPHRLHADDYRRNRQHDPER